MRVSPNTAGYCKARGKLIPCELIGTSRRVAAKMERACPWSWHGRRVMVVDGTGLSMPDTPENQAAWPQGKRANPGCGFPVMRVCALFSLATGAMVGLASGSLQIHERTLYRTLWRLLRKGDVLLGDRGFCAFADFCLLFQKRVDCVMRKHCRRKNERVIKRIAKNDRIVAWKKSGVRPQWLPAGKWALLPESLSIREVEVRVSYPGFRTQNILVVTTLLDPKDYPADSIAELYLRRWNVELFFRDIKTTLGMDILSCRTPRMIEIELWMHVIAYNLVRAFMLESAIHYSVPYARISFKGTLSSLRQFASALSSTNLSARDRAELIQYMLACIAGVPLPYRPGRSEPRARKRRPKNFHLLNKPRHLFREIMHRNRYKGC